MLNHSLIFENTDDNFNQSNLSFGDESFINNIIENDIDVNEDEMLAMYFLQKPEETNTKIQEEIEKTQQKINSKDNSDIGDSDMIREKSQNISEEIEKIQQKINTKDNFDIDDINIIKEKSQNISEEIEKTDIKISSKDNSDIDDSNTTKDRSSKSIKFNHKIKITKKSNEIIFKIDKIKKIRNKKGRLLKNAPRRYNYKYHDKCNEDNIIKKIKISFIKKTINYINKEYEVYLNKHKIKKIEKLIKKINPNMSTRIKKENNLKWFNSKLKDIFSDKVSRKYSKYNEDYNKEQIEQIYQENDAKKVINILDKKVRDMYYIYSKDIKVEGFLTLEDDLKIQRELMEKKNEEGIDDYLKKFQTTAQNFENIFIRKRSRNYNKKNNST